MITVLAAVWVTIAPSLQPRQEVAVAAAGGKLYLIGGIGASSVLASVEEYDPSTNRWRFVAPLPEPLHHSAAAVVDGTIYVVGGYRSLAFDATDSAYRYDPPLDRWTRVASLPSPRGAHSAAVIGGRIYLAGGVPDGRGLAAYDPGADRWTTLAPMPTAREHLALAAAGGHLYAISGRRGANLAAVERYDPLTDSWSAVAPIPTARSGIAAATTGERIYVFGGEGNRNASTGVFAEVESYDPATNRWRSEPPMPVPRHGIAAAVIGSTIYVPAGATLQGFGATAVSEALLIEAPPRRRSARQP